MANINEVGESKPVDGAWIMNSADVNMVWEGYKEKAPYLVSMEPQKVVRNYMKRVCIKFRQLVVIEVHQGVLNKSLMVKTKVPD